MSTTCSRCTAVIRTNSYKIQCNKCKLWCHRDCANLTIEELQLYTRDINVENGKKWFCEPCYKLQQTASEIKTTTMQSGHLEAIIMENNFLKRLLQEMEEKNLLLKQNKFFLEQKVLDLEKRLNNGTTKTHNNERKLSQNQYIDDNSSVRALQIAQSEPTRNTPKRNTEITPSYREVLLKNNSQAGTPTSHLSQGRRKQMNKRKQINIGTANIENQETDFSGKHNKNKKAWLFISRVKDHVTEEQIKEYIKNKTEINDDQDVVVKHIQTKYDSVRKDCQCFQVGVRFDLKEKLYENNFWPQKVAFRRYDFNAMRSREDNQDFLQSIKT